MAGIKLAIVILVCPQASVGGNCDFDSQKDIVLVGNRGTDKIRRSSR